MYGYESYENDEMWCGKQSEHYPHYWEDYYGDEWRCDG